MEIKTFWTKHNQMTKINVTKKYNSKSRKCQVENIGMDNITNIILQKVEFNTESD